MMADSLLALTAGNTSFSQRSPGLQTAVDSHSLGEFKTCPRRYYYSVVCGWQPRELSVHLIFGLLMHEARERYDHLRSTGTEHEGALLSVLEWLLSETWDATLRRPWISDHKTKNRRTLLQTVVWYLDRVAAKDPMETVQLESGPAVELPFAFDSGYQAHSGERLLLCGRIDRLARLNGIGAPWITDIKTTGWGIDGSWFSKFTPFNQFSLYCTAGQVVWHLPVAGLMVDGIQVGVTFSRFERAPVPRPPAIIEEYLDGVGYWLESMERCAERGHRADSARRDPSEGWPMNELSCGNYSRADGSRGGCEFREVCSRVPGSRQQWLTAGYRRRAWDPLARRQDI